MKVKKNRVFMLVISILVALGFVGLSIYQLINSEFNLLNLIMFIFIGDAIFNCFEKK